MAERLHRPARPCSSGATSKIFGEGFVCAFLRTVSCVQTQAGIAKLCRGENETRRSKEVVSMKYVSLSLVLLIGMTLTAVTGLAQSSKATAAINTAVGCT